MPRRRSLIRSDLITKEKVKTQAISNRMARVQDQRPMTREDALHVVAAQAGVRLDKYDLSPEELERVAGHLASLAEDTASGDKAERLPTTPSSSQPAPNTRAARFAARDLHDIVIQRSRRSFTAGESQDAVLKAFRSVNKRVKNLSGVHKDGSKLMADAFRKGDPALSLSDRTTQSEADEHEGIRFLMMGAVIGMRNPRAHEDHWPRDEDEAYVLDALAFASLLHRMLDIVEGRLAN